MNAKQTYLAWVRTTQPAVYYSALRAVFSPNKAGLGGLGDDLTDSIAASETSPSLVSTSDLSDIDTSISSDVSDSINNAYTASISPASTTQGGSTDFFGALANAITAVAPTVVQTQAAENLLAINTARAQQGLPPLTANGVPVTGSMLSPTSATVAQMEAALSGGSLMPILLIGGLAVLALALTGRSRG